jgi:hypothetical protein
MVNWLMKVYFLDSTPSLAAVLEIKKGSWYSWSTLGLHTRKEVHI